VTESSDREAAKGSKHVVSPLAGKLTLGTFNVTARLRQYVDTSSEETKRATTTALKEITAWVGDADRLEVDHIVDGNLIPTNAGVPLGPYSDSECRNIVKTIRDFNISDSEKKWDVVKTWVKWGLALLALWVGYLTFIAESYR